MSRAGIAFFSLFWAVALTAAAWLVLGAMPALTSATPWLHESLHEVSGGGVLDEIAGNIARTSHTTRSVLQVFLDYGFSVFNLTLGLLLMRMRPEDRAARLLALGLVGTAVAFNLRGHDTLQVLPASWLGQIDLWHVGIHVLSGLCYVYALVLFPDGRLPAGSRIARALSVPVLAFVTLVFIGVLSISVDDHTSGLVIAFGVFLPVVGLGAQITRIRNAPTDEIRHRSKVVMWALILAFGSAIPLMMFSGEADPTPGETVEYEIPGLQAGTYFFRCDPHPEDMTGTVRAVANDAPRVLEVEARDNRFDTSTIGLQAGERSSIRFTSFDSELHNIAIYEDPTAGDPIFIGSEFSGAPSGVLAFRIFRFILAAIPIALFVGLVRFRLWNIERVMNRTLVYGVLAAVITIVYLGMVVGLGAAVGAEGGGNLLLSLLATALLAAAFSPLRDRARRLANRLVYGKRATPYEVLSELSERVGDVQAVGEIIPSLTKALADGAGASRTEVWLRVGDSLIRAGSWPPDETHVSLPLPLTDEGRLDLPHVDQVVPVTYRGELLGAITLIKPPGTHLSLAEERLLTGVASQAGLMLRNAQLTAELGERLRDLRASRQRIVAAQDAERRRIERDIHDGAQQHLVAMSAKLALARELAGKEPERARRLLEELQGDTQATIDAVRDLARGIYPPILADRGLVHALEAHARRCPVPMSIEADDVRRLPTEVENAVYFCCLEAIANSIKHSGGANIAVKLSLQNDLITFEVADRGKGFDTATTPQGSGSQSMHDRMAALGGNLRVTSAPGSGTRVEGRLPLGE